MISIQSRAYKDHAPCLIMSPRAVGESQDSYTSEELSQLERLIWLSLL
jgi:hypothetical protein